TVNEVEPPGATVVATLVTSENPVGKELAANGVNVRLPSPQFCTVNVCVTGAPTTAEKLNESPLASSTLPANTRISGAVPSPCNPTWNVAVSGWLLRPWIPPP